MAARQWVRQAGETGGGTLATQGGWGWGSISGELNYLLSCAEKNMLRFLVLFDLVIINQNEINSTWIER